MKILLCLVALMMASTAVDALPRDVQQLRAFRKANPCPSTGKHSGRCPGYQVDHTQALMNGGADDPANMQWLANSEHRAKTLRDFAECKASATCLRKKVKRPRPQN